jgi:hypothetical protein
MICVQFSAPYQILATYACGKYVVSFIWSRLLVNAGGKRNYADVLKNVSIGILYSGDEAISPYLQNLLPFGNTSSFPY